MKRRIATITLSAALALAPMCAMAADASQSALQPSAQTTLAPGGAAGVQQAQGWSMGTTGWVLVGAAAVAIIIIAASNGGGNGHNGSSTTTTGAP